MNYKDLVVVGNGASVLQKQNGHRIDEFDYIVRMNGCRIKGYENYIGTKTSMYRAPWDRVLYYVDEKKNKIDDTIIEDGKNFLYPVDQDVRASDFLFIEPIYDTFHETVNWYIDKERFKGIFCKSMFPRHRFHKFITAGIPERIMHEFFLHTLYTKYNTKRIHTMTVKQRLDIFYKFNNIVSSNFFSKRLFLPSSGIFTLMYIIENYSREYNIWITGYDGFTSGMYWNEQWSVAETFFQVHSLVHERAFIKNLISQGIVKAL